MKTAYQTDDDNLLAYPFPMAEQHGCGYCLPYGAVEVLPPAIVAGKVARWVSGRSRLEPGFGEAGSGSWTVEDDHRSASLYQTVNGESYAMGKDIDGHAYAGIGPIPAWLTAVPWPGLFYVWRSGAWTLDADAQRAAAATNERAWRDAQIASTDFLMMADYPLDADRRVELQAYRSALRDWPENPEFPDAGARPANPAWLAAALA